MDILGPCVCPASSMTKLTGWQEVAGRGGFQGSSWASARLPPPGPPPLHPHPPNQGAPRNSPPTPVLQQGGLVAQRRQAVIFFFFFQEINSLQGQRGRGKSVWRKSHFATPLGPPERKIQLPKFRGNRLWEGLLGDLGDQADTGFGWPEKDSGQPPPLQQRKGLSEIRGATKSGAHMMNVSGGHFGTTRAQ